MQGQNSPWWPFLHGPDYRLECKSGHRVRARGCVPFPEKRWVAHTRCKGWRIEAQGDW